MNKPANYTLRGLLLTFLLLVLALYAPAQQRVVDSLLRIVALQHHDTLEAKSLTNLSIEYSRKDLPRSRSYARSSLALSQRLHFEKGIYASLAQLSVMYTKTGQKDSAHLFLDTLARYAQKSGSVESLASYHFTAGLIFRNEGNFREALPHMLKSLDAYQTLNLRVTVAGQLLNIGNTYHDMGDIIHAIDYHIKALKLFEELKNKRGAAFSNQNIGNDYIKLRRPREGLPYLLTALRLKQELNDRRGLGSAWSGMASFYKVTGDYKKSISHQLRALALTREFKLTAEEAASEFDLGSIYGHLRMYDSAIFYLTRSKVLAQQVGDSTLSKGIDSEMIAAKAKQAGPQNPEKILLNSVESSVKSGRKDTELSSLEHLIEYYERQGNFRKAFEFQKQRQAALDSFGGVSVQLRFKALEEQFNREKNEKEIVLLKATQMLNATEIKRQKTIQYAIIAVVGLITAMAILAINRYRALQRVRRLEEMERMRNTIARDLHDDIGSTLSSINIISRMALRDGASESRTAFSKIEGHTHKLMDKMSDIVWSINPANDTLDKMAVRMRQFTADILEPLNIRHKFQESGALKGFSINLQHRKNLFLIFKEALNNAAKYSQCENVVVELGRSERELLLSVRDDGRGFDPATAAEGNGLSNMRARAEAMSAKFELTSTPGHGTQITLRAAITRSGD